MVADPKYLKHAILFVDDEEQSQKYFSQIFGRTFKIYLASDGEAGLKLFEEFRDEIGVVVSDQRMPGMSGSDLLARIAEASPDVVNILSTAYSDLDAAIDAVNHGGIYRYVTKPWDLAELEVTLRRAMDYFQLKEQHRALANMKISGLEQMFHQSRLLACLVIPAMMECGPSAVRALRDLLRLSLENSGEDQSRLLVSSDFLSSSERRELSERVKGQLGRIMERVASSDVPDPEALEELKRGLEQRDADTGRAGIVSGLFRLLQGGGTDKDLESLSSLLNAYRHGHEIRPSGDGWHLAPSDPSSEPATVFEEIYSLFVDDSFLVSLALGEE